MTGAVEQSKEGQQSIPPVRLERVAAEDRKKDPVDEDAEDATPVHLNRGPLAETVHACKDACAGAVYDVQHWKELPAESTWEKLRLVASRGGRLPYLVLTVVVGFLAFFAFLHVGRWFMGSSDTDMLEGAPQQMRMTGAPQARTAAAVAPSVGPAAMASVQASAVPPAAQPGGASFTNLVPNFG